MKLYLNKTNLIFRNDEVATELLEGASLTSNGNVIFASENKIVYFPIEKGRAYEVSLTPISGQPVYKWANTTEMPVVGTSILDYGAGGGISKPLIRKIIAENNGYHIIEVTSYQATIKVKIVE